MAVLTPILNQLTPEPTLLAPPGFTVIDEPLRNGLPHTIRLDANYSLVLIVPTGLALAWRDANPASVISSSEAEREGVTVHTESPIGAITHHPARLLVRRSSLFVASVPLVAGQQSLLPVNVDDSGAGLELLILGWDLRAGSLRGPGDFGARLTLAWRLVGKATSSFSPPSIHPAVLRRHEVNSTQNSI
jgi:hypothetical protein